MENFIYGTPTKLIFGKGAIENLADVLKKFGNRILLTYGTGSIKRIGLYDEVIRRLEGFEVYELSGIEPNPKYDPSVLDGICLCRDHEIDVILAVGGGSVLDCSKAIAAGVRYDGEAWNLVTGKAKVEDALPIVDIMTAAATGSEYDGAAVISNTDTSDKIGMKSRYIFPAYSFLDPTYTLSVPKSQTMAGIADAICHVMEDYFVSTYSLLTDGMCEACIKSLIQNARILDRNLQDYEARSEVMLDCALACNGIFSLGNSDSMWPLHAIEHTLSAFYDITHGIGLAIIIPRWMRFAANHGAVDRIVNFGINIFGIDAIHGEEEIVNKTIEETYRLFESLGIPMKLSELGIGDDQFEAMAEKVTERKNLEDAFVPLTKDDIVEIFRESL